MYVYMICRFLYIEVHFFSVNVTTYCEFHLSYKQDHPNTVSCETCVYCGGRGLGPVAHLPLALGPTGGTGGHCPGASPPARPHSPHTSQAAPLWTSLPRPVPAWLSSEEAGVANHFGTVSCTCIDTGSWVRQGFAFEVLPISGPWLGGGHWSSSERSPLHPPS